MKKRRSREMAEKEGGNNDDEEEGEQQRDVGEVSSSIPTGRVSNSSEGMDVEDSDIERLEEEVSEMAERILNYRRAVPEQLKVAIGSFLVTSRPYLLRFGGGASDVAMGVYLFCLHFFSCCDRVWFLRNVFALDGQSLRLFRKGFWLERACHWKF